MNFFYVNMQRILALGILSCFALPQISLGQTQAVVPAATPTPAVASKIPKVLFLGDSLTIGHGLNRDDAFPNQVKLRLKKKGKSIDVVNAGLGGATTASGLKRLRWYLKAKPDVLVLALGANDGLRGLDLGNTEKNLNAIINHTKSKGLPIILAGMRIPPNFGPQYTKDFAALFPRVAKKHQITLIPFLLEGVGGEKAMNLPDGIHPNEKGHQRIAKTVAPFVEKELP